MIPLSEERKEVRDTKKEEMMIGMRDKFATDEKEKETQADQEMTSSLSVSSLFGLIYSSLFFFLSYEQKNKVGGLVFLISSSGKKERRLFSHPLFLSQFSCLFYTRKEQNYSFSSE